MRPVQIRVEIGKFKFSNCKWAYSKVLLSMLHAKLKETSSTMNPFECQNVAISESIFSTALFYYFVFALQNSSATPD